ncbi:MAG TPA: NAD-dependent epimerase/dehydratase family protein, partial [Fontimonas sp.]
MKMAVMGATGMLGRHTLEALLAAGHQGVAYYRSEAGRERLDGLDVECVRADLSEPASLPAALRGVDVLINAAAYYPTVPRPWQAEVETATRLADNLYHAAAEAGIARVVYVGGSIALPRRSDGQPARGDERYAEPPRNRNPYLQVKWALDELALQHAARGLPVSIAIPSMTFGEYDYGPTTGQIIVGIASGRYRNYVPGRRNIVAASDAGRGIVQVAERGASGQRYLLTGVNSDMGELTALIARLSGQAQPRPISLTVAQAVATLQKWRYLYLNGALP